MLRLAELKDMAHPPRIAFDIEHLAQGPGLGILLASGWKIPAHLQSD